MKTQPRGSALIVAVIAVLVITVIAIGIMRISSRELAGATAGAREQSLQACAEAARLQLLSQFHALGFEPKQLTALNVPLASSSPGAPSRAVGGHYDTPAGNIVIDQVTYLPESAFGPTTAVRDDTGTSSLIGTGGKPVKVVVHCQDGSVDGGRQLEVEFGVLFGL